MAMLDADALVGLLDGSARNYRAVVNNIANVNTPGYKTTRVRFTEALDQILDETCRLKPGAALQSELIHPELKAESRDGNNVRLEREIVEMNKTVVRMKTYLAVLHARIRRFRAAIDGR